MIFRWLIFTEALSLCLSFSSPLSILSSRKARKFVQSQEWSATRVQQNGPGRCRLHRTTSGIGLFLGSSGVTDDDQLERRIQKGNLAALALFGGLSALYWYWLVFGAAATANGLPGVPDFIPNTPGWPPSDNDLLPVIEDSYHFFYLSELLGNQEAPLVSPVRLAAFNLAEAWIFAFLPLLWKDRQRLPRPLLLGLWATLGLGLTNAFLAPYLFVTQALVTPAEHDKPKNQVVCTIFGGIATAVVGYAAFQCLTATNTDTWKAFGDLIQQDRTYLAFCVDPILFSIFQPLVLARVKNGTSNETIDFVPFFGLISWLFARERQRDEY